jgi:hypothetical protein
LVFWFGIFIFLYEQVLNLRPLSAKIANYEHFCTIKLLCTGTGGKAVGARIDHSLQINNEILSFSILLHGTLLDRDNIIVQVFRF